MTWPLRPNDVRFVEGCVCVRGGAHAHATIRDATSRYCVPNVPDDVRHVLTRITSTMGKEEGKEGCFSLRSSPSPALAHD